MQSLRLCVVFVAVLGGPSGQRRVRAADLYCVSSSSSSSSLLGKAPRSKIRGNLIVAGVVVLVVILPMNGKHGFVFGGSAIA